MMAFWLAIRCFTLAQAPSVDLDDLGRQMTGHEALLDEHACIVQVRSHLKQANLIPAHNMRVTKQLIARLGFSTASVCLRYTLPA